MNSVLGNVQNVFKNHPKLELKKNNTKVRENKEMN